MSETLYALLTNEGARDLKVIEASLSQEAAAGAPWFDK